MISSHLLAMVEDICTHVLIVNQGRPMFFGPIGDVHEHFADGEASSLEEIFLRATESIDEVREFTSTAHASDDGASNFGSEQAIPN